MPVFSFCFRQFDTFPQIHAAVTQVERLVDEREVRNDVAVHRVLEERPVLPGRIVRVQAVDATCARDIEGDQHLAAPALDPACARRARCSRPERRADVSVGQLRTSAWHEGWRGEVLVALDVSGTVASTACTRTIRPGRTGRSSSTRCTATSFRTSAHQQVVQLSYSGVDL